MGSFTSDIVHALIRFLKVLFQPVTTLIQQNAHTLIGYMVGTPAPNRVFGPPTNPPWDTLYRAYWQTIVPVAMLLWALAIGIVIFLESTNHLFSGYHRTRLKRRTFTGLLGILSWWWLAALSLQLTNGLITALLPDLSHITLFQTLSFSALTAIGLAVSLTVDLVLFILIALIYFVRLLVLYLFVLLVPILLALWIPGLGPFAFVSAFVKRIAGFYVPFLLMPLPIALLFQLANLLGTNFAFDVTGVFLWITALIIPLVAVVSPFIFVWQAGALLFMGDRLARRTSLRQGRQRVTNAHTAGRGGVHGGRNFARGVRGAPAIRRDGQTLLTSNSSRAHAAGTRLRTSTRTLRARIRSNNTPTATDSSSTDQEASRDEDFTALREQSRVPSRRTDDDASDDERADEQPRYIH